MTGNDLIITLTVDELRSLIRTSIRKELAGRYKSEVDEKLLSAKEVSSLFTPQLHRMVLTRLEKRGKLTPRRIGKRKYYRHGEVLAAMEGTGHKQSIKK